MCFPFSISATCCSSTDMTAASFTFSKVVLTSEETKQYQLPWEKQQQEFSKKRQRSSCICWCCLCTCLWLGKVVLRRNKICQMEVDSNGKPVHNRLRRRVSSNIMEKRAACYKQLIEMIKPTCDQIGQWSTNFETLMEDEGGRRLFDVFLQQEHSEENLLFWSEVTKLRSLTEQKEEFAQQVKNIYLEFLKPMAAKEINIAGTTRRKIEEDLQNNEPPENIYDAAQSQVYLLMHRQSYPRFLASDLFNTILQSTYAYNKGSATLQVT